MLWALIATTASAPSIVGYYSWNWGPGSDVAGATDSVAFTGLIDVKKAINGYTPGASWCCPVLRGRTHLSLGGGNAAGMFTDDSLSDIVKDLPLVVAANYSGIVFDVEEVEGPTSTMIPAFAKAFAACKRLGLIVTVTTSHSAPYQTDTPADAVALLKAWVKDDNIDVLSPQLYSSGQEQAPDFSPTANCAEAGCTWDLYADAKPRIVPSIVDAKQYGDVVKSFPVATAGYIEWAQHKSTMARTPPPRADAVPSNNASMVLGAYFANWAQYHTSPYTHTPADLAPIVSSVSHIYYSFIYFCPPAGTSPMPYWAVAPFGSCTDANEFSFLTVEAKDAGFMQTITAYKAQNPSLKVIASIGGWNFPSAFFSRMAASPASRAKFIASAKAFLTAHQLDGIDLDWEYPCSPPRPDPIKISCAKFRTTKDAGGTCPQDTDNLLALTKELRAGLGDGVYLSIASQAGSKNWPKMNLKAITPYLDHWHVMSYDYSVSDITDGATAAPNMPLNNPAPPALQESISQTVDGYLAAGVPPAKMLVGIAYYGHTWYKPGLSDWQSFGFNGTIQGKCCGPFKSTYGTKPGKGCSMCGTMMYSELRAAGGSVFHDNTTASDVAYFVTAGGDGYTEAGTWVTYSDQASIAKITTYAKTKGLGGVFVFDTSMDTLDFGTGTFTYELTKQIAAACGPPSPPAPSGCPGGSLQACMSACPPTPLKAYKACVADCARRCK